MTSIATFPSNSALRFNAPRVTPVFVRWAAKLGITAAVFLAVVGATYLVLPRLEGSGIWAYGVGFLVQATTSASIMVPVPGIAALVVMSQGLNVVTLAVFGAAGGAVGELFAYWIGYQGRGPLAKTGLYNRLEAAMRLHGGAAVFMFAAVPVLPMDAAGVVAGVTRYPIGRFLVATFAGKLLMLIAVFWAAREFTPTLSFVNAWG